MSNLVDTLTMLCNKLVFLQELDRLCLRSTMKICAKNDLPKQFTTSSFVDPTHFAGKLNRKVSVVIGAFAGLGRVAALAFSARGARVTCITHCQDSLGFVMRGVRDGFTKPNLVIRADIAEPAAPTTIVKQSSASSDQLTSYQMSLRLSVLATWLMGKI
jgi:hypothetical protein